MNASVTLASLPEDVAAGLASFQSRAVASAVTPVTTPGVANLIAGVVEAGMAALTGGRDMCAVATRTPPSNPVLPSGWSPLPVCDDWVAPKPLAMLARQLPTLEVLNRSRQPSPSLVRVLVC